MCNVTIAHVRMSGTSYIMATIAMIELCKDLPAVVCCTYRVGRKKQSRLGSTLLLELYHGA